MAENRSIFKNKGVLRILVIFQDRPCSAISFKSSRRELSIDAAEHRPTSKNNQNAHYLRFSFIPKTAGIAFHKTGVCFYCTPFPLKLGVFFQQSPVLFSGISDRQVMRDPRLTIRGGSKYNLLRAFLGEFS